MVIEFLCPNGHRIHCPDDQAGRAAKCPRCGVKFRIPQPSEAELPETEGSDISQPELTDSGVSAAVPQVPPGKQDETPQEEEQIEFLCPSGHRLHGPASLQGRPGQCPECGSKFRIPTYDDVPEEEEAEQQISLGRVGGEDSALGFREEGQTEVPPLWAPPVLPPNTLELPATVGQMEPEQIGPGHPLAELFWRLWTQRAEGATVELHLAGGQTILPDMFNKTLSQQKHGVFAIKDPEGTYTLTAVAWESIVRVVVRGLRQVPEGMSD